MFEKDKHFFEWNCFFIKRKMSQSDIYYQRAELIEAVASKRWFCEISNIKTESISGNVSYHPTYVVLEMDKNYLGKRELILQKVSR